MRPCVKRLRTSDESKPQNNSKSTAETPRAQDTNTTLLEIVNAEPWEITAGIMEDIIMITLVDRMNQALVRLQEKTVDHDVLRQTSDRPKDKVNYFVPDSQSQSQSNSGGDGGEELAPAKKEPEESNNGKDGASLGFKPGVTIKDALKLCVSRRAVESGSTEGFWKATSSKVQNLSDSRNFEVLTQKIVNMQLDSSFAVLQEATLESFKGSTEEFLLYKEQAHKIERSRQRKPDALFYRRGKDSKEPPKFTEEAQSLGALVTVEVKASLGNKDLLTDALQEIERYAAAKTNDYDIIDPQVSYSVITDGVEWRFARLSCRLDKNGVLTRYREVSKPVIAKKDNEGSFDFWEIAQWLLFIVKCSVDESSDLSGYPPVEMYGMNVKRFLRLPSGTARPVVARVARADSNEGDKDYILKYPVYSRGMKETNMKMARRLNIERKFLTLLQEKEVPCIVRLAENSSQVPHGLLLKDAGTSLNECIVSGKSGENLAKMVYRDIWAKALASLSELKLCFADIHPGNICIKNGHATLVDLESMMEIIDGSNNTLDGSPIMLRTTDAGEQLAPTTPNVQWDKACVAAMLRCLMEDGSFTKLKSHTNKLYTNPAEIDSIIKEVKRL